jgi:AAA domain
MTKEFTPDPLTPGDHGTHTTKRFEPKKLNGAAVISKDTGARLDTETPQPSLVKSSKDFVADFVPPDYTVDGLLQGGFLYSLTGATGAGKTCLTLRLAASVALGVIFANRETKKGRVLYLAAENPDDVRMRWIALAQHMDFDVNEIEVYFVEGGTQVLRSDPAP